MSYFPKSQPRGWLWMGYPALEALLLNSNLRKDYQPDDNLQLVLREWVRDQLQIAKFGNSHLLSALEWLLHHEQYTIVYLVGTFWLQLNEHEFVTRKMGYAPLPLKQGFTGVSLRSLFIKAEQVYKICSLSKAERLKLQLKALVAMERDVYELLARAACAKGPEFTLQRISCALVAFGNDPNDSGHLSQFVEHVLLPAKLNRRALDLIWRHCHQRNQPHSTWLMFSDAVLVKSPMLSIFGLLQAFSLVVWSKRTMGHLPPFPLLGEDTQAYADKVEPSPDANVLFYKVPRLLHRLAERIALRWRQTVPLEVQLTLARRLKDLGKQRKDSFIEEVKGLSLCKAEREIRFQHWAALIEIVLQDADFMLLPPHKFTRSDIQGIVTNFQVKVDGDSFDLEAEQVSFEFTKVDSFFIGRARDQLEGFTNLAGHLEPVGFSADADFDDQDNDRFEGI